MDIKDYILIGGGLLIAAVVAHGFWIAWRARREPLRLDIVPNLFPENVDDIEWLRGELPNGGARVKQPITSGEQVSLELDAPLLLEPTDPELTDPVPGAPIEPSVGGTRPAGRDLTSEGSISETPDIDEALPEPGATRSAPVAKPKAVKDPDRVANVEPPADRVKVTGVVIGESQAPVAPARDRGAPPAAQEPGRPRRLAAKTEPEPVPAAEPAPVEELLILNVVAPYGNRFTGAELFAALRRRGLKFGNMNIFHRVDPLTKMVQYSVANVVEPGTFDMADMDAFRSPGMCFFLQLPGPERPADVLEDMFEVASAVAADLRGELKDEQHNLLTPQMVEHYRQRIMDYTRRRMSKRA